MDIFKIADFLYKHRKKILLINHILMILVLVNLVFVIYSGKFETDPLYYIWMFILRLVTFIIIHIQLSEED